MITLQAGEDNKIQFELDIESSDVVKVEGVRLIIENDSEPGTIFGYNGSFENNIVTVDVNNIEKYVESKNYNCYLEVLINGHYFRPVKDVIEVKKQLSVKAVETKVETIKKPLTATAKVIKVESKKKIKINTKIK